MMTTHVSLADGNNIFADLWLPDAAGLQIKARLAVEIQRTVGELALTQDAASAMMGITQRKLSNLLRGPLRRHQRGRADALRRRAGPRRNDPRRPSARGKG